MRRPIIFILFFLILFGQCSTDKKPCTREVSADVLAAVPQTQLTNDVAAIDAYLTAHSIVAEKEGALRYTISTAGTGDSPCLESSVSVVYVGKLLTNGNTFDSTTQPISLNLNDLILGWKVGFLKLNRGTVATLYIPSGYAYGTKASTGIPANSNLIFEVQLIDFAK